MLYVSILKNFCPIYSLEYEYKYIGLKYDYFCLMYCGIKYKYLKSVLKYDSSTSTKYISAVRSLVYKVLWLHAIIFIEMVFVYTGNHYVEDMLVSTSMAVD